MIVDNKGRLFGKLNLLDLLFALILIAVIFVAYALLSDNSTGGNTKPITYTVEVQNREAAYFEHIVPGEQVTDGVTKAKVGVIKSFKKEPAKVLEQADDRMVLARPEDRFDGYVQIEANASVEYPHLLLDGVDVKVGKEVAFRSESLAIRGYIVAIDYDAEQLKEAK